MKGQTRSEERKDNGAETRGVPRLDGSGQRIMEKVVIQGLANPISRACEVTEVDLPTMSRVKSMTGVGGR